MNTIARCAVCHAQDPGYLLIEHETGLRAPFCMSCLRNTVRFLSHPQDLARCLRACRGSLPEMSLKRT